MTNEKQQSTLWILVPIALGLLAVFTLLKLLQPLKANAQASASSQPDSLVWPISGSSQPDTDAISSPFGPRWQASQERYDYHPGIDIAEPVNTPVHVVADGVVSEVGWLTPDSGLTVIVSHTLLGYYSAYLHLNSAAVNVDQPVTQGQVIGNVGNTGTTDFMHLHFEIRLSEHDYPTNTRNPMAYLPRPELTTPDIEISSITSNPIYSPTVTLIITATREELDVNKIRVFLQDRATGQVLDDQLVDFNLRLHTGEDDLDQDGIQLTPTHFNTSTVEYGLSAYFYRLQGMDALTITAQVVDLAGNTDTVVASVDDTTPPSSISTLMAHRFSDGSIELGWRAPGDSGEVGTAGDYEIRYANAPIDTFTWYSASSLPDPPTPLPAGTQQTWRLPGPLPANVYFAIKSTDPEGNLSLLSNSAKALGFIYIPFIFRN